MTSYIIQLSSKINLGKSHRLQNSFNIWHVQFFEGLLKVIDLQLNKWKKILDLLIILPIQTTNGVYTFLMIGYLIKEFGIIILLVITLNLVTIEKSPMTIMLSILLVSISLSHMFKAKAFAQLFKAPKFHQNPNSQFPSKSQATPPPMYVYFTTTLIQNER